LRNIPRTDNSSDVYDAKFVVDPHLL
jgi:hypothetical protein